VLVEPAPPEDPEEREVKLSVIQPAPKPTPVGVGADGGSGADEGEEGSREEPTLSDSPPDAE
jgi:hypothetical protein